MDKKSEDGNAILRREAEEKLKDWDLPDDVPAEDAKRLIQELRVHQIELEMQNEELRKTQAQLEEFSSQYADLYDFAPVGYVTLDEQCLIWEANLTAASQLGTERARLRKSIFPFYVSEQDKEKSRLHIARVFKTRERQTCEVRLRARGSEEFYARLESIFFEDKHGTGRCRTSIIDISRSKIAEQELRLAHDELERRVEERTTELSENERNFRKLSQEFLTLLNAISDTLILLSPEMEVLWTNNGNALGLNEAVSDPVGHYCYKLLHDRSVPSENSPIRRCFDTAEKEAAIVRHNGAVLDLRAFPVKEAGRVSSVLLLVSDITEKMAMQAEAMQAGHMASLGELAAGVAHEINNPITGIINYGQILINECSPESMEKDLGERIVKEGERIGRIVSTLLSYARSGRQERKPTRVPAILEESIILIQAQIRKEGIDLKVDLPDDLPQVDVNFQQLQQGFINIINNARYALNEKYPGKHKNKRFEITGEKVTIGDRPYVRIVFYDQGVGISPHELSVLTKPFFSTKPLGKGTGLGLNITQTIITDHGGQLSFESTKGEFTRVIIDLPASRGGSGVENECENSCNR